MLPVMVFIHGGEFLRGYGGGDLYDCQYIVNNTNVIAVTINYRLGALGYAVYGDGDDDALSGNYGTKDQRLALKWVRDNIAYFGGNPNQVTLFGQSAGAISAAVHMTSERSAGLFHRVIMESEPFGLTLKGMKDAVRLGKDFARELGCHDASCIRNKSVDDIVSAEMSVMSKIVDYKRPLELFLQWTPCVDGDELPLDPLEAFRRGLVAPMPMIIGNVKDESVFFIYEAFKAAMDELKYDLLVDGIFVFHSDEVKKQYPPQKGIDERPEASVLGTDYTFVCPTRNATDNFLNTSELVWLYLFDHPMSFGWGKDFAYCNNYSCHGGELVYVFHTASLGGYKFTADEIVLSDTLIRYWTNFARYGNPNGDFGSVSVDGGDIGFKPQKLEWPPYMLPYREFMHFKTPLSEVRQVQVVYNAL
jgi:carboxylesterase type B